MKKAIRLAVLCLILGINCSVGLAAQRITNTSPNTTIANGSLNKETANPNGFSAMESKLPTINKDYALGVSGAFGGLIGNKLILAGGYNYPGNELHNDVAKQYYKDIIVGTINPKNKKLSWKRLGELPKGISNGAAVATDEALYIIGGRDDKEAMATCIEIKLENKALTCKTISQLPVTVSDAGAVYLEDYLYVVGGIQNGQPSNDVYRMNLKGDRSKWEKLPAFPEEPRIQPIVAAQKDGSGKTMLYLWSGFNGWGKGAALTCGGYKYNPATKEWKGLGAPLKNEKRVYLGGGNAVALGDDRIIAFGGFSYEILLNNLINPSADYNSHDVDWYKHNQEVYCYNTRTGKWSSIGSLPSLGTVHAAYAKSDGVVYNISGELKPGVNTNIVTRMSFE